MSARDERWPRKTIMPIDKSLRVFGATTYHDDDFLESGGLTNHQQ